MFSLPLLLLLSACGPSTSVPDDTFEESSDFETAIFVSDDEPTVIVVSWTTDAPASSWVEFGTDGKLDLVTSVEDDGTTDHKFRLVGLPSQSEVTFRAVSEVDGEVLTATGSAWTRGFAMEYPEFVLGGIEPDLVAPNQYLAGSIFNGLTGVFVTDRAGRLLWFWKQGAALTIPKIEIRNGTTELLAMVTPGAFGTRDAEIHRFSIADGSEESFVLPGGAHHAFTQLPDGSIAYIHADIRDWENPGGEMVRVAGDAIAIRTPDGDVRELFTIWDWREPVMNEWWEDTYFVDAYNWTHANALDYDPNTDTFLLSLRNCASVVEVDAGSGAAVRWFGTPEGYWYTEESRPFYYQHDVKWSRAGTLLASITNGSKTFGIEYEVDEDARRLREIWSFGEDLQYRASVHGGISELDNGNRLVNWGSRPEIREVTPEGQAVWDIAVKGQFGLMSILPMDGFYDLQ